MGFLEHFFLNTPFQRLPIGVFTSLEYANVY